MWWKLLLRRAIGAIVGIVMAFIALDTALRASLMWFAATVDNRADALTVMTMPLGAQIVAALGWFVAAFVGAYVTLRIGQWRPAGWIAPALILAIGIWNIVGVAQPLWLQIAAVAGPILGAWLAERHFHRARRGDPLIN